MQWPPREVKRVPCGLLVSLGLMVATSKTGSAFEDMGGRLVAVAAWACANDRLLPASRTATTAKAVKLKMVVTTSQESRIKQSSPARVGRDWHRNITASPSHQFTVLAPEAVGLWSDCLLG